MSDDEVITRGSDNVYADLGYADASTFKLKAELVRAMAAIIKTRGFAQVAAAERMGVSQPEVSRLVRGQFRQFSTDRLLVMLSRLEVDIDITLSDRGKEIAEAHMPAAVLETA